MNVLVLLLCIPLVSSCGLSEILQFCQNNGFKFLDISQQNKCSKSEMVEGFKVNSTGLRIRQVSLDKPESYYYSNGIFIGFYTKNYYSLSMTISSIFKRKILSTILVVKATDLNEFLMNLKKQGTNAHFYVLVLSKTNFWKRIIMVESQLVMNSLRFDPNGMIKEEYDLQKIQIIPSGLTWNPYLKLENCDIHGRNCDKSGMLVDIFSSWADDYNFTWDVYNDQTGSWTHHFNDVVLGNYPMSLSFWLWIVERDDLLDFIPVTKDFMILSMIHDSTAFDVTFFLRD